MTGTRSLRLVCGALAVGMVASVAGCRKKSETLAPEIQRPEAGAPDAPLTTALDAPEDQPPESGAQDTPPTTERDAPADGQIDVAACGQPGQPCCVQWPSCWAGGCCLAGSRCVAEGETCGDSLGVCSEGGCNCGGEGQLCCLYRPCADAGLVCERRGADQRCGRAPFEGTCLARQTGPPRGCCAGLSFWRVGELCPSGGPCASDGSCGQCPPGDGGAPCSPCGLEGGPCCVVAGSVDPGGFCSVPGTRCVQDPSSGSFVCGRCGQRGERCCDRGRCVFPLYCLGDGTCGEYR
jgi:hypothetical protein